MAKFLKLYAHLILLMSLSPIGVFANWSLQNSGVSNNLNSVVFLDTNTGFAVGNTGILLQTSDGGKLWSVINSGTKSNLNEICFTNKTTGWVCGDGGIIKKTTDAGKTWTDQNSGTSLNLESIYFYDTKFGWAVGDAQRIVSTENGGAKWTIESYTPYDASVVFRNVKFIAPNIGWIVGDAAHIVRKSSGSSNWYSSKLDGISDFTRFNKIYFFNQNTGWIVGRRASLVFSKLELLKTNDTGNNWHITHPDPNGDMGLEELNDVQFINLNRGWAVGQDGKIINSKNGGVSWVLQESVVTKTLNSVFFVDENNGWIVGNNGLILSTTNGGETDTNVPNVRDHTIGDFSLKQNYPNPCNSSTVIEFELNKPAYVTLNILNVSGQTVAQLSRSELLPGVHKIPFQTNGLASGIYFYQLTTNQKVQIKRLLYLQ